MMPLVSLLEFVLCAFLFWRCENWCAKAVAYLLAMFFAFQFVAHVGMP